jgi:hypothetical protein
MAKLDWLKGGFYEADPARVQQVADFVTPDRKHLKLSELTKEQRQQLAASAKRRAEDRSRQKTAEREKRQAKQAAKQVAKAKRAAELAAHAEHRKHAQQKRAIRLAAEEARMRSPEYIAAQQAEQARLAQVAHEQKLVLLAEREVLRKGWRQRLLGR